MKLDSLFRPANLDFSTQVQTFLESDICELCQPKHDISRPVCENREGL